jgi:hypothetical protein
VLERVLFLRLVFWFPKDSIGMLPLITFLMCVFETLLLTCQTPISFSIRADQKLVVLVLASLDYQAMLSGKCVWLEAEQLWQNCNYAYLMISKLQPDNSYLAAFNLNRLPQDDSTLHFMIYNDGVVDATVISGFYRTINGAPTPGNTPDDPNPDFVSCNPSGKMVWEGSPSDCVEQHEGGSCAWCNIRANGAERASCVFRDGLSCVDMAESPFTGTYCNIGFECPGSILSISLLLVLLNLLLIFSQ